VVTSVIFLYSRKAVFRTMGRRNWGMLTPASRGFKVPRTQGGPFAYSLLISVQELL